MKAEWLKAVGLFASTPADFYSGNRKIIRQRSITFTDLTPDIDLADIGFTKNKLAQLRRNYLHEESRDAAVTLWDIRTKKAKYGSVGFHCFKHYVKGKAISSDGSLDTAPVSKRASVMGPCIQSLSLTWLHPGRASLDVFYRTTELFKKCPADLIWLPELMAPFDFSKAPLESVTCHFSNVTCHPMYFASLLPLYDDPVEEIARLEALDPYFHKWVIKWTARYLCPEYAHGILKFAQALRVRDDVMSRLNGYDLERLQEYLRANHPGYTHTRFGPAGEEVSPAEDDEEGE